MNKTMSAIALSAIALFGLAACSSEATPAPTVTVTQKAPTPTQEPALTTEDYYIQNLRSFGNYYVEANSDATLIDTAYSVCTDLDSGYTVTDIVSEILLSPEFDATDSEAVEYVGLIIGASVAAFCPEYTYQIEAIL